MIKDYRDMMREIYSFVLKDHETWVIRSPGSNKIEARVVIPIDQDLERGNCYVFSSFTEKEIQDFIEKVKSWK